MSDIAFIRKSQQVFKEFSAGFIKKRNFSFRGNVQAQITVFQTGRKFRRLRSQRALSADTETVDAIAARRNIFRDDLQFRANRRNLSGKIDRGIIVLETRFRRFHGEPHRISSLIGQVYCIRILHRRQKNAHGSDSRPASRKRIENSDQIIRSLLTGAVQPGPEVTDSAFRHLANQIDNPYKAVCVILMHAVRTAAADGVMRMIQEKRPPEITEIIAVIQLIS